MTARIRIKDHDRRPQFSIAVVLSAALVIWFAIWRWNTDINRLARRRDLTEARVVHECDDGHRFWSQADVKSLPCAHSGCELRAWPVWSYQCTRDGAFLFQIRYERLPGGACKIRDARPVGGAWQEHIQDDIACPVCGWALLPDFTMRNDNSTPAATPALSENQPANAPPTSPPGGEQ